MTESSSDAVTAHEAMMMIIEQIEYYFGDFNLSRNNFLKEKTQEDDGWVTIDTMLNFNRLKKITDDAQMICEALKKSSSVIMEVIEQGDKIRRSLSKPLSGDTRKTQKEIIARTVYAKPFPLDVSLLMKFFEGYRQVVNMWFFFFQYNIWFIKRHIQKEIFKRCEFETFSNKEDAKEKETEVDLEEWVSQKMTKNAVLHLSGLNSETSIEQVKAYFSNVLQWDVAWVDIVKGATEGYIILRGPNSAGSTLEKGKSANDRKVVIQGAEIEVRVVEGDEELQNWKKIFKDIADQKKDGGKRGRKDVRNQRGGQNRYMGEGTEEDHRAKGHTKEKDCSDIKCSDVEEQHTEEKPAKVIKSEMVITGPPGKMHQKKKDALSDGDEQDTEEPPAKITKSELVIKFQEVLKFNDASCDGEEQDTEDPPVKVIKSELVIKFQKVLKFNDASCDKQEQDTEDPPAKVIKSEMIITRSHRKRKQNKKQASGDGEEQDTEEPPAKIIKSEMNITKSQRERQQNKMHASSDGEEQDAEEPPAMVTKSEKVTTRAQGKRKQNKNDASNDGEKQDTDEPPAKVTKSENIITRAQ